MISFNDAVEILGFCQIPFHIQEKILMYFLSYGTLTSNLIKIQTKCPDTSFNGSLVERIILQHEMTLWRLKVFLNGGITSNSLCIKNLRVSYELRIAYLSNGSNEIERIKSIKSLTQGLETNRGTDLYQMFYGFDKYNWKKNPIGTQSSIIMRNAIRDGIVKEFDPIIYYSVDDIDSDAEYY